MWALNEHILGANPAVVHVRGGAGFAQIFYNIGTEEQKKWAVIAAERGWGATMVLTEPDAGSDVGAGRTKAVKQDDGTWHIDGVKRFITSGDSDDLFENIFHLVLARPEGAGPGTKGLSLFFVPKFHFDPETGELGERNGVYVTNVEHKMGLKVSATCELSLGQHDKPAVGWLVGEVHDGIAQMFDVIEQARMMVGTKAIATLSTGYLNALEYAKERMQGADMTQMTDKTAPRVTITHHPDVRRSLMTQKAYAEGLRALYMYTATYQDAEVAKAVHGIDAELAVKVNDLMLPIVKGVGSEQAYAKLTESLQRTTTPASWTAASRPASARAVRRTAASSGRPARPRWRRCWWTASETPSTAWTTRKVWSGCSSRARTPGTTPVPARRSSMRASRRSRSRTSPPPARSSTWLRACLTTTSSPVAWSVARKTPPLLACRMAPRSRKRSSRRTPRGAAVARSSSVRKGSGGAQPGGLNHASRRSATGVPSGAVTMGSSTPLVASRSLRVKPPKR